MQHTNYRRPKANAGGRRRFVKFRVVRPRVDDRIHRERLAAAERRRNKTVDEQPRERRVAVREMERVRALLEPRGVEREAEAVEADRAALGGLERRRRVYPLIV